jgi:hypothetical protein
MVASQPRLEPDEPWPTAACGSPGAAFGVNGALWPDASDVGVAAAEDGAGAEAVSEALGDAAAAFEALAPTLSVERLPAGAAAVERAGCGELPAAGGLDAGCVTGGE